MEWEDYVKEDNEKREKFFLVYNTLIMIGLNTDDVNTYKNIVQNLTRMTLIENEFNILSSFTVRKIDDRTLRIEIVSKDYTISDIRDYTFSEPFYTIQE